MAINKQQAQEKNLKNLISYLDINYYNPVALLCEKADLQITIRHNGDGQQAAFQYTSLSKQLTTTVTQYIRLRHSALLPYVQKLIDKKDSGHDCSFGNTSCTSRHAAQICRIKLGHTTIHGVLSQLRAVVLPLEHPALHSEDYKELCATVAVLDRNLTDIFHLEESTLIPKVMDAQRNIHAHG